MYAHTIKLALILLLFILLNACTTLSGTPKSPLEFSDAITGSHDTEDILNKYAKEFAQQATQEVTSPERRNTLISKALTIMDVRYAEFINNTETNRKNKEMFTDLVELSMNLAGTVVGAAGTKTILAAISAGINGINGSIDTNYFYQKTFQSLVAQMNADRKAVLVYLTKGMTLPIENYQWAQAVHDLIDYYNAGTLLGAISSIQKEAGEKEHLAEDKIIEIRQVDFKASDAGDWLENYIKPRGFLDENKRQHLINACIKLTPLWKENPSGSVVAEFLYAAKWESQRIDCKNKLTETR
ncbi:MAG: hypothetical protein LUP96_07410 [Methylococcaceae bacterium]|nr:hypothetical protein [Methylococcaceae bacterium]